MPSVYVIHENEAWIPPLAAALDARGVAWQDWFMDQGSVDFAAIPPEGVFYNRMSASAHTRDHRYAGELTTALLAWLEGHGRRVVNGASALDLEISKARQYAALSRAGIRVPRTVAVVGEGNLVAKAREVFGEGPFILKPNRGGKGLGVALMESPDALAAHLEGPAYEAPIDGVHLLQSYIRAPEPFITRAEFVGGKFVYAVRVDTSDGFELCPADACVIEDANCPVGEAAPPAKFTIVEEGIDADLRAAYERFLADNGIEVAGIEFIRDADGTVYTYDVNTNTNYNPEAEAKAGRSGMAAIADFLAGERARLYPAAA